MTHPHAEILRAIADGVPLSEFEVTQVAFSNSYWFEPVSGSFIVNPEEWQVRRKSRTHVVNGFTVPAPMDKEPDDGRVYFIASPMDYMFARGARWDGSDCESIFFERGLCFATREAAVANAKAMLKIDPEAA